MNVLVINAGSSSLKYQLLNPTTGELLAKGLCERIGIDGLFTYKPQLPGKEAIKAASVSMPTHSEAIQAVLNQMGKTTPDKELNCGCCGYPTCRDKAIAVCQGKAVVEMCLPFLKEKAESFSDKIIGNTPNAIIVMDEDLVVQQINRAAVRMFKLKDANDILHEHIVRILNPGDYQNIITSALHTTTRMHYLADYELYVDETILYDRQYHIVISLMRDVTEQETLRGQDAELRRQTVEITDKVIEKQMRVVQEIASLLGETTAETKIALTKLKDAMAHE